MAMSEPHLRVSEQPAREDVDDRRARPPGDVEARHRVSVTARVVSAPLGPADSGEDLQPTLTEPAALLPRGKVDVGVRPLPRPVVLRPIETRGAKPVLQRQLVAVADAQPPLFGAVDEEQPAEGPECLTAEVVGVLLVNDQNSASPFDEFACRDQTGQSGPNDDDISICHAATVAGVDYAASVNALYEAQW